MTNLLIVSFPKLHYAVVDPEEKEKEISIYNHYLKFLAKKREEELINTTTIDLDSFKTLEKYQESLAPRNKDRVSNYVELFTKDIRNRRKAFKKMSLSTLTNRPDLFDLWTLKDVFFDLLSTHNVITDTWFSNYDEENNTVLSILRTEIVDKLLNDLVTFGFGKFEHTFVCIVPTTFCDGFNVENEELKSKDFQSDIIDSIRTRLTVSEICDNIIQNSIINFDKLISIMVAGIIVEMGLIFNDITLIVAGMCVCPMMGPILAIAFSLTIGHKKMLKTGFRNESLYFISASFFGFLMGILTSAFSTKGALLGRDTSWPTKRMTDIGNIVNIISGTVVAFVSGLGVAFSLLGGNVGLLVGIAIATSILPPSVNSGMFFGHAIVWSISHPLLSNESYTDGLMCKKLINNEFQYRYVCHAGVDMLIQAMISLLLYVVNVVFIIIAAILTFKIKLVTANLFFQTATDKLIQFDFKAIRNKESEFFEVGLFSKTWLESYVRKRTKKKKVPTATLR